MELNLVIFWIYFWKIKSLFFNNNNNKKEWSTKNQVHRAPYESFDDYLESKNIVNDLLLILILKWKQISNSGYSIWIYYFVCCCVSFGKHNFNHFQYYWSLFVRSFKNRQKKKKRFQRLSIFFFVLISDALKLTFVRQRTPGRRAATIGTWLTVMDVIVTEFIPCVFWK